MSRKLKYLQSNQQRYLTGHKPTVCLKEFFEKSAIRTTKVKVHFLLEKQINQLQTFSRCSLLLWNISTTLVRYVCYVSSTCIIASKERKRRVIPMRAKRSSPTTGAKSLTKAKKRLGPWLTAPEIPDIFSKCFPLQQ